MNESGGYTTGDVFSLRYHGSPRGLMDFLYDATGLLGDEIECLKCGNYCGKVLVGDEQVYYCKYCNYYDGR